jgi:hypothetical protein
MSLFRYKGSKVWTMDFMFHGQRVRESTGTTGKTLAMDIERKRRRDLEAGAAGIKKRKPAQLLSVASEAWLESKDGKVSARSIAIENANLKHILPDLGKKLVTESGSEGHYPLPEEARGRRCKPEDDQSGSRDSPRNPEAPRAVGATARRSGYASSQR